MEVANPKKFLESLNQEGYSKIRERFGAFERFLRPGDTFKFTCDKSGKCCKDRFENPILISPYDFYRLRTNLNLSSHSFVNQFGEGILGTESKFPIMLLDFKPSNNEHNKCPFLRSYECKVYEDRPLVCRLYPVGRIVDKEMNSYFFLTKTADYCKLGNGKEYTIEQWLQKVDVGPYFEWNDRFNSLFLEMNHDKYRKLNSRLKSLLGKILYEVDELADKIPEHLVESLHLREDDNELAMSYRVAKGFIECFVK